MAQVERSLIPHDRVSDSSNRRCVVTGECLPKEGLVRLVVAPDDVMVPDLAEKLPGRGFWLKASRPAAEQLVRRRYRARRADRAVMVPPDLADRLESLLLKRAVEAMGLARRSGVMIAGRAKVEAALRQGRAVLRLEACDGSRDERRKLDNLGPDIPVLASLSASELALAFDREHLVHAALCRRPGGAGVHPGLVSRVRRDFARLAGFRRQSVDGDLENTVRQCNEGIVDMLVKDVTVKNDDHR